MISSRDSECCSQVKLVIHSTIISQNQGQARVEELAASSLRVSRVGDRCGTHNLLRKSNQKLAPPGIKLTESGSFLQEALVPMLQLFSLGPKINREIPGREPGNSLAP